VRRTQLYLEDDLWQALRDKAARDRTTISELVRVATRDRYLGNLEQRREAMMGIVGLWKERTDLEDTGTMIRRLRKSTRRERLGLK
jgi:hypothetical protein